jgi:serine/threonine-protein kinase
VALPPGTRVGPYEILSAIGAGGMGEVYRARDTKLNRDVALKILPEAFTLDGDRTARFRREAQVLASLNHPNIAAIYGFEDSGSTHALVLELVEGPTLADRIAKGPIPLDEALPIASQIAEALDAAHEHGIVHRDLKPANTKLRPDGTVKVLDFGLAKALEPAPGNRADVTNSPTITSPALMTGVGMLLGTAAYMSPEQAKGRPADKRSDVWAFGCVLYEMLTGKRAFEGEDVSDTLAFILTRPPDWDALAPSIPASIRKLLRRCLERDPRKRLAQIAVARYELDEGSVDDTAPPRSAPHVAQGPWWKRTIPLAAAAVLGAGVVAAAMFGLRTSTSSPVVTRFALTLERGTVFTTSFLRSIALSPDGTRIAFVANRRLYLRSMSEFEARPIAGTDWAGFMGDPEFSPDGSSIVFWAGTVQGDRDNALRKIAVGGGTAQTLAKAQFPYGITWSSAGIIFGTRDRGIMRLSPDGGEPQRLVAVKEGEIASVPQMLPDGQTLLYTLTSNTNGWDDARVVVQSLKSGVPKTVVARGTSARYLSSGHLVYAVGGILFAVPFDLQRLETVGGPVQVVEGVLRTSGNPVIAFDAQFGVSLNGSRAYLPGPANFVGSLQQLDLAWTDRTGKVEPLKLPPRSYVNPRLSPDGKRLAFGVDDGTRADIWVHEVSGASSPRLLTFGGHNRFPVWSADSQHIVFQSDRDGDAGLFWQRADVSGTAERLTKADPGTSHVPDSWSPKADILLFDVVKNSNYALRTLSLEGRKSAAFGQIDASDPTGAVFSPDGRWVAYSGGMRPAAHYIYVQPFPATGERNQISAETDDGHHPMWSQDGKALFFIGPGRFVTVGVSTQPKFSIGSAVTIPRGFTEGNGASNVRSYDVSPDGQRFIGVVVAASPGQAAAVAGPQLLVVSNWFEELKQRVPGK